MPFSAPVGPNGPYFFGFPDDLVGINFPDAASSKSKPWYWFVERVRPFYFQYIGEQAGGHGWQATQNFPVIKILPIDTQPIVPTPFVGFNDLETAIHTGSGDGTFGRFMFQNKSFWKVLDQKKPEFSTVLGIPTQTVPKGSKPPISTTISKATKTWEKDWNTGADAFNKAAHAVAGGGNYGAGFSNGFKVPFPFGYTLPQLQNAPVDTFYFGAIPPTAVFDTGQAYFWKQAQGFRFRVAQLDDKKWDMSIFPPTDSIPQFASFYTHDYGGYGQTDFPQFFNVV